MKNDDKFYKNSEVILDKVVEEHADSDLGEIQTEYKSASDTCNTLHTVVPKAMAIEQQKFNFRFKQSLINLNTTVDEWVAKKLHYNSVEDLCFDPIEKNALGEPLIRFAKEQIDAIGTAIWNYENNGDAIIIADQTGVGKGRQIAGLLRYAILELGVIPFFFTEKIHLINDIYRDLIDIGFDAGVVLKKRVVKELEQKEYTDKEILKIIINDIKNNDAVSVEYSADVTFDEDEKDADNYFNLKWIVSPPKDLKDEALNQERQDLIDSFTEELIDLYRQKIVEEGIEQDSYDDVGETEISNNIKIAKENGKHILKPFIPVAGFSIKDKKGNIIYDAITKKELEAIYRYKNGKIDTSVTRKDLVLPSEYKLFAIPYSQVQTAYTGKKGARELNTRIKLFQKYCAINGGSVVILDECHNASGGRFTQLGWELSNVGKFISEFCMSAKMVTYVSATYAKRPDNMPLYALKTSIRESGLTSAEMINTFKAGDNALQEAVASELTRNGQLLRREKKIQGTSDYYYENENTEIGQDQIAKLNKVSALFEDVLALQSGIHEIITEYRKNNKDENDKEEVAKGRSVKALSFQLFNFMLLGMKIRQTTEFAIKALKEGKKPVITVASTLESALNNLSKTFKSNDDVYKIGDTIKNDFSLYMAYLLNYTMRYTLKKKTIDDNGNEEIVRETIYVLDSNDELSIAIKNKYLDIYESLLERIIKPNNDGVFLMDTGISIAPIDQIKQIIKNEGFTVGEITGRQRCVEFTNSDFSKGVVSKRTTLPTTKLVSLFNENELDCLIINKSGATGVSMHATPSGQATIIYPNTINENGAIVENAPKSLENKKEVKKRCMINTQMDLDINVEVQKLGRINRTGQVYSPEYTYVISAVPSEARLTALSEKKLRSLSANVSASQTQASYLFSSEDLFSDIATEPCEIALREASKISKNNFSMKVENKQHIQEITKMFYFKPFQEQKVFYDTFAKELEKEIAYRKSLNLYVGEMSFKNYYAITKPSEVFPFYIGDRKAKTSFGGNSSIEKSSCIITRPKTLEKDIAIEINDRLIYKNENEIETMISSLSEFKKKQIEILNRYEEERKNEFKRYNEESETKIKGIVVQIEELKGKLKAFDELEKALLVEQNLKDVNNVLAEKNAEIIRLGSEGEMEELTKVAGEIKPLKEKKAKIELELEKYKEILLTKGEHKEILREIKSNEEKIERENKKIERNNNTLSEYRLRIENVKKYINIVGTIQQQNVYEEDRDFDNQNELGDYFYTQKLERSIPVVVTGVSFPTGAWGAGSLIDSSVNVHLTGIELKETIAMSKLERKFTEREVAINRKQLVTLETINVDYKKNWNIIASKEDTSSREDKYFIVGSLLKTYSLSRNNGLSGGIVKYNTNDNKIKIGIEVSKNNVVKTAEGGSSQVENNIYKELEARYSEGSTQNSLVYFDGNKDNTNRFIAQYVYEFMFGEEKNQNNKQSINENLEFIFQISSTVKTFLVVKPSHSLIKISEEFYRENSNYRPDFDEAFKELLHVKIFSEGINTTLYFAVHLEKYLKVGINSSNFAFDRKQNIANYPHIESTNIPTFYFRGGTQYKTFIPTNLLDVTNLMGKSFKVNSILGVGSYLVFEKLIEEFEKRNRKPNFATTSSYFSKFKNEYSFEQFSDEGEDMKIDLTKKSELTEEEKTKLEDFVTIANMMLREDDEFKMSNEDRQEWIEFLENAKNKLNK